MKDLNLNVNFKIINDNTVFLTFYNAVYINLNNSSKYIKGKKYISEEAVNEEVAIYEKVNYKYLYTESDIVLLR